MWTQVALELTARQVTVSVPDVTNLQPSRPHWRQYAECAALAIMRVPAEENVVLVGHSGAGALLPAIRWSSGRPVAGYLFIDAGLPNSTLPPKGAATFAAQLAELHAHGGRYPNWTDADLAPLIPNADRRRALLEDLRPQPPDFWDEVIPVFEGWPDAPCGYLAFVPSDAYAAASAEARARGWAHREIEGSHFHMLVDERAVSDALVALAADMGIRVVD